MNAATRRMKIMDIVKKNKSVEISDLAQQFNVVQITIRRDLSFLEEQGFLTMTHGGAVLNAKMGVEQTYVVKRSQMTDEKQRIGVAAAEMVKEGEVVFLDCGTTAKEVAVALSEKRGITVVTNSILVADTLVHSNSMKLNMVPGEFRSKVMGFIGTQTMEFVQNLRIDKFFMGADGLSIDFGASTPDSDDRSTKRAIARSAGEVILVTDHMKLGLETHASILPVSEIDILITGKSTVDMTPYENEGLHIITV